MPSHPLVTVGILCLALSGCTVPGVETSRIESAGLVDVGGKLCDYEMRVFETPTVNGMSRYYESTITCDGQSFACGEAQGDDCVDQVAAALARP
jgi:hypothetical protein